MLNDGSPAPVVVAAHGGSGATTLARLLRAGEIAKPSEAPPGSLIVIAARGNGPGLRRAVDIVSAIPERTPAALVLTADAPLPLPPKARARVRLLQQRVSLVAELPYVPAWRYDDPAPATASRRWRASAADLARSVRTLIDPNGETR